MMTPRSIDNAVAVSGPRWHSAPHDPILEDSSSGPRLSSSRTTLLVWRSRSSRAMSCNAHTAGAGIQPPMYTPKARSSRDGCCTGNVAAGGTTWASSGRRGGTRHARLSITSAILEVIRDVRAPKGLQHSRLECETASLRNVPRNSCRSTQVHSASFAATHRPAVSAQGPMKFWR